MDSQPYMCIRASNQPGVVFVFDTDDKLVGSVDATGHLLVHPDHARFVAVIRNAIETETGAPCTALMAISPFQDWP